jgi:hypothetical protein
MELLLKLICVARRAQRCGVLNENCGKNMIRRAKRGGKQSLLRKERETEERKTSQTNLSFLNLVIENCLSVSKKCLKFEENVKCKEFERPRLYFCLFFVFLMQTHLLQNFLKTVVSLLF